jgi:tryptophan-rich sensory protein
MNWEQVDWKKLLISIAICQFTGILGGLFTYSATPSWYVSLTKPSFVPPNWSFSIVWPLLNLLMGIALYIIWKKGLHSSGIKTALSALLANYF